MARSVHVSEDIVPLGEFKTQASRVLRRLREANRAVVITQNGRPAAVLIAPEEFDRLCELERFVGAVRQGLQDSEAGRVIDDARLAAELKAEYGPPEDW